MIRTWSAVEQDGQIVCIVEDRKPPVTLDPTPEWRMWAAADMRFMADDPHAAACIPGSPCAECRAIAPRWWRECGKEHGWPLYRSEQVGMFGGDR